MNNEIKLTEKQTMLPGPESCLFQLSPTILDKLHHIKICAEQIIYLLHAGSSLLTLWKEVSTL